MRNINWKNLLFFFTLALMLSSCSKWHQEITYRGKKIPVKQNATASNTKKEKQKSNEVLLAKNETSVVPDKVETAKVSNDTVQDHEVVFIDKKIEKKEPKSNNKKVEAKVDEKKEPSFLWKKVNADDLLVFNEKLNSKYIFPAFDSNQEPQWIASKDIQSSDSFLMLCLYILLCFVLPPLAVLLMMGGPTREFWIDLLLVAAAIVLGALNMLLVGGILFTLAIAYAIYIFVTEFVM